ncbi:MAG: rane protein [Hyphomicrobiales bacterium]|nr:rane protein [Hyphomicrobiales bacterium]
MSPSTQKNVAEVLRDEWRHLTKVNTSDRPWQMPVAAALSAGLPIMVGAATDHLDYGLVASLGGMVFLYLPGTPLHHRMVTLMACAFGVIACYTLGLVCHFIPLALTPLLALIAMLVTMVVRFYRLGPPGAMFFVMAASIAAFTPTSVLDAPMRVGLITLGCLQAALIAFIYSLVHLRVRAPLPVEPLPAPTFDFVIFDSIVIGASVGLSLAIAQALQMPRAYWVPISCLAVVQGVSLRAVWNRQVHRIAGTGIGLGLAWALIALPLDPWSVAVLVIVLSFIIETLVVRHYGFAVLFIKPVTILLAEDATLGAEPAGAVIEARFFDTVLGCLVGLAGGFCLHSHAFRERAGGQIRRLVPARFGKPR